MRQTKIRRKRKYTRRKKRSMKSMKSRGYRRRMIQRSTKRTQRGKGKGKGGDREGGRILNHACPVCVKLRIRVKNREMGELFDGTYDANIDEERWEKRITGSESAGYTCCLINLCSEELHNRCVIGKSGWNLGIIIPDTNGTNEVGFLSYAQLEDNQTDDVDKDIREGPNNFKYTGQTLGTNLHIIQIFSQAADSHRIIRRALKRVQGTGESVTVGPRNQLEKVNEIIRNITKSATVDEVGDGKVTVEIR